MMMILKINLQLLEDSIQKNSIKMKGARIFEGE